MSTDGDEKTAGIPGWLEVACSRAVVRRALVFFFFVGGILIAINHGDALVRGDVDGNRVVKMVLTPLVPYMVSTISSVGAIRNGARERLQHDRRFHADD
ncbi:MAG: nitrate/nitrite transporter NrtS [bacterium]|nr:nitrate/nitrite transporter NrtS [bacterium]